MALPQELIDIVTDNIQNDPVTLKACSYAASSFRRSSQRHLFSRIKLLPPRSAKRSTPCEKFHEVLASAPHLASYVRCLEILEGYDTDGKPARNLPWIRSDRTLELVLPLLRLRRFSLHCTWPASLNISSLPGTLKAQFHDVLHSPTLASLSLGRIVFTPSNFHFYLDGCRSLKELTLSNVSVHSSLDVDDPETVESDALRAQLESLDVVESDGEVIDLLLSLQSPVDLRHLRTMSIYGYLDSLHLNDLVQRPRATLQHLGVWDPLGLVIGFDTTQHENLRSLFIAPLTSVAWTGLLQTCSPRLQQITFELPLDIFKFPQIATELAEALLCAELPHLCEVNVEVHPGYRSHIGSEPEQWTLLLESAFADFTARLTALSTIQAALQIKMIPERTTVKRWSLARPDEAQAKDEEDEDEGDEEDGYDEDLKGGVDVNEQEYWEGDVSQPGEKNDDDEIKEQHR
ncbi:hypothetical protein B0H17DRAFT_121586 [Mycena rosella]|uniref:Uncharacterized protein n=1 Tax=Mycena rosella TaxID=1033263 RepID=A0AAD7G872_MYCRO|nr:hypothetical protein B0H17DRAFT_121586 [Mycena rosella]